MWVDGAMARITLYLDRETEEQLDAAARAAGTSRSRWLADLIRKRAVSAWPAEVASLAGSWAAEDFPTLEEIRRGLPEEAERP
jgi:hypothetical protein